MLVWQGAFAFERWTGTPAPVDIMRAAAEAHFAARTRAAPTPPSDLQVRFARPTTPPVSANSMRTCSSCMPTRSPTSSRGRRQPRFRLSTCSKSWRGPIPSCFWPKQGDKAVGYLYADVTPAMETSSTYTFDRLHIHHIAVLPEAQGHGCGTALIEAAKQEARRRGIPRLSLATWDFNRRAQRFFESQGFVYYGHRMWLQGI